MSIQSSLTAQVKASLKQYEDVVSDIRAHKQQHQEVFDRLEELVVRQMEIRDGLERLLYTKSGPPKEVPIGAKSYNWAKGTDYMVQAQYKKKADYYDPAKLPKACFAQPGVVKEVNTAACDALAVKDPRVAAAKVPGEYMKSSVLFVKLTTENAEVDDDKT